MGHLVALVEILILLGIVLSRTKGELKGKIVLMVTLLIILLVFFFYNYILSWFTKLEMPGSAAEFGDQFGCLNALFSGLALGFVVYTVYLQAKELALQREEMKNSNVEYAKQTLESALFEYLKYMQTKLPEEQRLSERLLQNVNAVKDMVSALGKQLVENKEMPDVRGLVKKVNDIRETLVQYATFRRIYYSWELRVEAESEKFKSDRLISEYKKRLWHLLPQEERRILYLQNAFMIKTHTDEWEKHRKMYDSSVCIAQHFKTWTEEEFNFLILSLKRPSKPPKYPIQEGSVKSIMKTVYQKKKLLYSKPTLLKRKVKSGM